MTKRRTLGFLVATAGFATAAVLLPRQRTMPAESVPAITADQFPVALSDSAFGQFIERLSEKGGYFDTDNLISNESSYLHVIGRMESMGVRGGAYLGVGPEQNFSYIVTIHPRIAFILDIRRDNLLEHLMFKVLFEAAPTRIEYLSLLFGRVPPADAGSWQDRPITDLVDYIDGTRPDSGRTEAAQRLLFDGVQATGYPLSPEDISTIERIHRTFVDAGPGLRYNSHGRAPRASYPTYRQLLLEKDRSGRRSNYLTTEEGYRLLREMEQRNLIVPVVGDFAGDHALRDIATWLRQNGLEVSAFYLSNVEFYLWQDRTFGRFASNVATLPFNDTTVMIRSLFGRVYGHPQAVIGYNSTQLMQSMKGFVGEWQAGGYATYGDLVYKGYIDLR
jgi:hypothetical protein